MRLTFTCVAPLLGYVSFVTTTLVFEQCLGEDPNRDGLLKTPLRAAKALCYFTRGYETTLQGECAV